MAVKFLRAKSYADFSKGVWESISESLAPENSVKLAVNFNSDDVLGNLVTRFGTTRLYSQLIDNKPVLGLHNYRDSVPNVIPSMSPSVSLSPSISVSPSASPSVSPSVSKSPSLSPSVSPSTSKSPSLSPSISPSLSPSPSPGSTHTVTFTSGSGSWVAPSNATIVTVECWGGGGNGEAHTSAYGGGGGAYASSDIAVTPGGSYAYSVGATAADSSFGTTLVVAKGGTSGSGSGHGTGGQAASSTGSIKYNGGNGGDGYPGRPDNGGSGGGGGAAGPSGVGGAGGNAGSTAGATGGSGNAGGGGAGGGAGLAGGNNVLGGGGGGGSDNNAVGGNGGAPGGGGGGGESGAGTGAAGQVRLTWLATSISPSVSPSVSKSPSASPSTSPSVSVSPSASPSMSPSVSVSPSISPSPSPGTAMGDKLFAVLSDGTNNDIYDVITGSKSLEDDTKDLKTRFLTYLNSCLRLNGTDEAKAWNGTQWLTTGGAFDLDNLPTGAKYAIEFKDRVFVAGMGEAPDRMDGSGIANPSTRSVSWTSGNIFIIMEQEDGGGGITGLAKVPGYILAFKKRSLKRWDGSTTFPEDMINQGAPSQEAIAMAQGLCFWVNENGAWVTEGGRPKKISTYTVDKIIASCSASDLQNVASGTDEEHVFWSFASVTMAGETYTNVVIKYNILQNTWDVRQYQTLHRVYTEYVDSAHDQFLILGDDDGTVRKLDVGNDDDGTPIYYSLETHDWRFGFRMFQKAIARMGVITRNISNGSLLWRNTHNAEDWKPLATINSEETDVTKEIRGTCFNFKLHGYTTSGRATVESFEFPDGIKVFENV